MLFQPRPIGQRVAAWIDDYNRDRKHSACRVHGRMRSPIAYELALHDHNHNNQAVA